MKISSFEPILFLFVARYREKLFKACNCVKFCEMAPSIRHEFLLRCEISVLPLYLKGFKASGRALIFSRANFTKTLYVAWNVQFFLTDRSGSSVVKGRLRPNFGEGLFINDIINSFSVTKQGLKVIGFKDEGATLGQLNSNRF